MCRLTFKCYAVISFRFSGFCAGITFFTLPNTDTKRGQSSTLAHTRSKWDRIYETACVFTAQWKKPVCNGWRKNGWTRGRGKAPAGRKWEVMKSPRSGKLLARKATAKWRTEREPSAEGQQEGEGKSYVGRERSSGDGRDSPEEKEWREPR